MRADETGFPLNRRSFLGATAVTAGAVAAGPLLAACGTAPGTTGTTSASQLAKILPAYVPSTLVRPDIPSVNGSDPGYLTYPGNLVRTVSEVPGAGGSYTTITPLWGAIPPAHGNGYYAAMNQALGADLSINPSNGNTYANILPPLFAANKLPDWIQIPSYMTGSLNFGQAVAAKFADLTPYLSGNNIKKYPNLANIGSSAWQAAVWNNKIYGIPSYPSNVVLAGMIYYRADILAKLGIGTPDIRSAADLLALGKELNDPKRNQWAFDDLMTYLHQPFGVPNTPPEWTQNAKGDLVSCWETEQIIEAMNWEYGYYKAGLMNPQAIALNTNTDKQRFYSAQNVITGDGSGAWNGTDTVAGKAANPSYLRMALPPFTASGTGRPTYAMQDGANLFSYLNKSLSKSQIEECLRIANYLAAPYGSQEYTLANFGRKSVDWMPSANGPVPTAAGSKYVATTFEFLASAPSVNSVQSGYTDVVRAIAAWQQNAYKSLYKPLFYDMNITIPPSLNTAMTAAQFTTSTGNTITDVCRGRATIAQYRAEVRNWQRNGGNALRKFFEGIRTKYGDA